MRGDHMTLDAFLDALQELAIAGESYKHGYTDGFYAEAVADWSQTERGFSYRRGHWNGSQALARGAHQGAEAS